jgi:hypothetical protein
MSGLLHVLVILRRRLAMLMLGVIGALNVLVLSIQVVLLGVLMPVHVPLLIVGLACVVRLVIPRREDVRDHRLVAHQHAFVFAVMSVLLVVRLSVLGLLVIRPAVIMMLIRA